MIDNTIIKNVLRNAWKCEDLNYWTDLEEVERDARGIFFWKLSERVPARNPSKAFDLEETFNAIKEAAPSLTIVRTKGGIRIDIPGDSIGINIAGGKVSLFCRELHSGCDVSTWTPEDLAKVIAAMADFDSLSVPFREKVRKQVDEEKRRKEVKDDFWEKEREFREIVYPVLADNRDTSAFRDKYLRMRKVFYKKLGDEYDEGILENDWKEFKEDLEEDIRHDRSLELRKTRAKAKEKELDICAASLEAILDRPCWAFRCSPCNMKHWDEYVVELNSGQPVSFKDYSRETGSLNRAIIKTVPILEAFLPYASTNLSIMKRTPPEESNTTSSRAHYARAFLNQFGDDEILATLQQKLKATRRPVILLPRTRSIKLLCFYPDTNNEAILYFTLKKPSDLAQVEDLVSAVRRLYSTFLKYWKFSHN
ncbi:MAG: hypothetical protein IKS71_07820 [Bacteroidales bacterium]|nr:hypothetical protein [Bacteroidales bacterium]